MTAARSLLSEPAEEGTKPDSHDPPTFSAALHAGTHRSCICTTSGNYGTYVAVQRMAIAMFARPNRTQTKACSQIWDFDQMETPRSSCSVDLRSAATPAEVQAILAEVTMIRPELTAFFGCRYYAAPRPAEAVALLASSCTLPSQGWGQLPSRPPFPGRRVSGLATARHANRPQRLSLSGPLRAPRNSRPSTAHPKARKCQRRRGAGCGGIGTVLMAPSGRNLRLRGSGTRPVPQPCRRTGTGAQPARRPRHSVRVLLTIYVHCIPGCAQIASQHIEQALRPSQMVPAGPQKSAQTPGIPSVMRSCDSWTQWDTAGPEPSAQIGYTSATRGNADPRGRPTDRGPGPAVSGTRSP